MKLAVAIATLLCLPACTGDITTGDPSGTDQDLDTSPDPEIPDGPVITRELTESDEDILNPERGYYVGYDLRGAGDATFVRAGGKTLAITLVRLDEYRHADLDDALLEQLDAGFAQARAAGIKVILRFMYNSSETEDASRARILRHLEQLTPLLHANADVIAVMQAGFIGAWGEWHSSTNDLENDDDRTAILEGLLAALPAHRGVQVRTPMYKAAAFGSPVDAASAYSGSARARVGHHNDCFLASETDMGTYDAPVASWSSYVEEDGQFTAIGGETCRVYTPRTNCEAALAELEAKHFSYLNRQYHEDVLEGWIEGGCAEVIARRFGYRFALDRVSHSEAIAPGGELVVELDLHNSGFAAPFNRRPVELVLTDGTTRRVVRLADVDARRWAPGVSTTLAVRLRVPTDIAPGNYTLSLRLPDESPSLAGDPRYAIRFANADVWNAQTGDNVLSTAIVIDPAAPGPRVSDAPDFVELR